MSKYLSPKVLSWVMSLVDRLDEEEDNDDDDEWIIADLRPYSQQRAA